MTKCEWCGVNDAERGVQVQQVTFPLPSGYEHTINVCAGCAPRHPAVDAEVRAV